MDKLSKAFLIRFVGPAFKGEFEDGYPGISRQSCGGVLGAPVPQRLGKCCGQRRECHQVALPKLGVRGDDALVVQMLRNQGAEVIGATADFGAVQTLRIKAEAGAQASSLPVTPEIAEMVARGDLTIPVGVTHPLDQVRDAYAELE